MIARAEDFQRDYYLYHSMCVFLDAPGELSRLFRLRWRVVFINDAEVRERESRRDRSRRWRVGLRAAAGHGELLLLRLSLWNTHSIVIALYYVAGLDIFPGKKYVSHARKRGSQYRASI